MFVRSARELSLLCFLAVLAGCSNPSGLDSIQIAPGSQSLGTGQTAQFTATGIFGNAKHPSTQDVTDSVTWSSSTPAVATINSSGLATAVGTGSTVVTANAAGYNGPVSSSATLTVTGTGTGTTITGGLLGLTVIPQTIDMGRIGETGQFLAIGTFSTAPYVRDLTNSPDLNWTSSLPNEFTINSNTAGSPGASAGTVTVHNNGSATIVATATVSDGSVQVATATANCPLVLPNPPTTAGSCYNTPQGPIVVTLTIYGEGLGVNSTGWLITAPSATGTPNVIHCGPGSSTGSVCEGTYPLGTSVIVTAPAESGVKFGGWSFNCTSIGAVTEAGPNSCTVIMNDDATVAGIFN